VLTAFVVWITSPLQNNIVKDSLVPIVQSDTDPVTFVGIANMVAFSQARLASLV
jgi:hypothetical protein